MDLQLQDRVALLTGASRGIGLACARTLLQEGARVAVSGPDAGRAQAAAARLDAPAGRVLGLALDLADEQAPSVAVDAVRRHFGAPPTLLVSSTGGPPAGCFDDLTDADWERAADLVLRGLIRCVRAVLPDMRAAGYGRIVAITSGSAREPIDGLITSSTLRAGVSGLVNALSRETGHAGITVNAILPGYVATDRLRDLAKRWGDERGRSVEDMLTGFAEGTPLGRIVEPAEVGAAVAFLCSAAAAPITGTQLAIDGGRLRGI